MSWKNDQPAVNYNNDDHHQHVGVFHGPVGDIPMGMKIHRLSLSIRFISMQLYHPPYPFYGNQPVPSFVELHVTNEHWDGILSMEANMNDQKAMDRIRRFTKCNSFQVLSLQLPPYLYQSWGYDLDFLILSALEHPDLEQVEVFGSVPYPLLQFSNAVRLNYRESHWTRLGIYCGDLPQYATLVPPEASIVSQLLEDLKIKILTLDHIYIVHEDAAYSLAYGIANSKHLEILEMEEVSMGEAVKTIIGSGIGQNKSMYRLELMPNTNDSDNLALLEAAIPNENLAIEEIYVYRDLRVFEVVTPLLLNRRSLDNLQVWIESSSDSGVPPNMDAFLDALASNESLTDLGLTGHIYLTKDQLRRMWHALTAQGCLQYLELNMTGVPEGWENDFLDALPNLRMKSIVLDRSTFRIQAVIGGWQRVYQAVKPNYYLEHFHTGYGGGYDEQRDDRKPQEEIARLCRLNAGGRRLEVLEPFSFNKALWPLVLERLNDLEDCWAFEKHDFVRDRADIIYDFLHGPLLEALLLSP